jgi:hypothetical protein
VNRSDVRAIAKSVFRPELSESLGRGVVWSSRRVFAKGRRRCAFLKSLGSWSDGPRASCEYRVDRGDWVAVKAPPLVSELLGGNFQPDWSGAQGDEPMVPYLDRQDRWPEGWPDPEDVEPGTASKLPHDWQRVCWRLLAGRVLAVEFLLSDGAKVQFRRASAEARYPVPMSDALEVKPLPGERRSRAEVATAAYRGIGAPRAEKTLRQLVAEQPVRPVGGETVPDGRAASEPAQKADKGRLVSYVKPELLPGERLSRAEYREALEAGAVRGARQRKASPGTVGAAPAGGGSGSAAQRAGPLGERGTSRLKRPPAPPSCEQGV